jgi:hypothetical protein
MENENKLSHESEGVVGPDFGDYDKKEELRFRNQYLGRRVSLNLSKTPDSLRRIFGENGLKNGVNYVVTTAAFSLPLFYNNVVFPWAEDNQKEREYWYFKLPETFLQLKVGNAEKIVHSYFFNLVREGK